MIGGVLKLHNPMGGLVWLALFLPGNLLEGRLALVLPAAAVLLGAAILPTQPSGWETRRPARQAAMIFCFLALLDLISYAYSLAFNGVRTGSADFFALSRPLYQGVFVVYLIRHYDASVRKSMEAALAGALYVSLFLLSLGVSNWAIFGSPSFMGFLAFLWAIDCLFFSRAPLRLVHAVSSILLVLLAAPSMMGNVHSSAAFPRGSPILGWGPASYEPMLSYGNQYVRWYLRNGVVGISVILVAAGFVAFHLVRDRWDDRDRRAGAALFFCCLVVMLMIGPFLDDFRLFVLTAFLIAGMRKEASS
ncbi:MAG: hypothetical protein AAB036_08915 [Elusimicrobiota bacterium]